MENPEFLIKVMGEGEKIPPLYLRTDDDLRATIAWKFRYGGGHYGNWIELRDPQVVASIKKLLDNCEGVRRDLSQGHEAGNKLEEGVVPTRPL